MTTGLVAMMFGLVLAPSMADAGAGRHVTKVAANVPFDGDVAHATEGRVFVTTPSSFHRISRTGVRVARFEARVAGTCAVRLWVAVRNVATRDGSRTQVRRSTRFAVAEIGEGTGSAGPWRTVELPGTAYGEPAGVRKLYGIASKRLAHRRYLHVRVVGRANVSCTDRQLRSGGFAQGLNQILRTALVDVVIRPSSGGR